MAALDGQATQGSRVRCTDQHVLAASTRRVELRNDVPRKDASVWEYSDEAVLRARS